MNYTIQELEAMCEAVKNPTGITEYVRASQSLVLEAAIAIPELIARIRALDPDFNAAPPKESVARATELMREAGEKRAKLESALKEAQLGNMNELSALGLEAFLDVEGTVKIRPKQRERAAR
jgi:hypothetical protein